MIIMKNVTRVYLIVLLVLLCSNTAFALEPSAFSFSKPMLDSDPYSLIAAVNQLRAANGLAAYSTNPILMGIAQSHAGFMAASGVSHYGVGGSRPYQRAIAAGYPLAGDLTQGGLFSENITAGSGKSVSDAVLEWQGDAPHLNTMLSPSLTEIGAGVVQVDGYYYYVIDCGRSTESSQPQVIPTSMQAEISLLPSNPVVVKTLVANTPESNGKTFHEVREGETLWLIAVSYGTKIDQIKAYNPTIFEMNIYPGQKLLIPVVLKPTATPELSTLTPYPSQTASPATATSVPVLSTPQIDQKIGNLETGAGLNTMKTSDIIIFISISMAAILLTIGFIFALKKMQE